MLKAPKPATSAECWGFHESFWPYLYPFPESIKLIRKLSKLLHVVISSNIINLGIKN